MTSIPTFRGPVSGDYQRARGHEIARIRAHLGSEPVKGPDGLFDFGKGVRGYFSSDGTPMRMVDEGVDAHGRRTRSFVRFDHPRKQTPAAPPEADQDALGECGAAWARRVLGKVEPPTPQPGSLAARAVALGYGRKTKAVAVNSEGEDGAEWARRILNKKTG